MKYWLYFLIITTCVALLALGGMFYVFKEQYALLEQSRDSLLVQNHNLLEDGIFKEKTISELQEKVQDLQERLGDEIEKFDELEDRVKDSLETVETFKKLSQTDPQLLQKYSKVYFLNEHYEPKDLEQIEQRYVYGARPLSVKKQIAPFLEELLEDAEEDNIQLRVLSAYRSFDTQASIKQNYVTTFGATAANTFSADQGYSEHQLGTTVDFTTPEIGGSLSKFKDTDAYEWLEKRAHRHGFTLSYPEDNTYYQFEPWHWRFVGKELAKDLNKDNQSFYDLSQRVLNTYLVNLFDD